MLIAILVHHLYTNSAKILNFFNITSTYIELLQYMGSFISRLDEYMQYSGLNDNQVTNKAKLAVGAIGKARKRDSALSADNIEKLLYAFTDINARWLITGTGEMIEKPKASSSSSDTLTNFIIEQNKQLQQRVEELLIENIRLEEQLKVAIKNVQPEEDVGCVTARKSV